MEKWEFTRQAKPHGPEANIQRLRFVLTSFRDNGGTYEQALAELNATFADDDAKYSYAGRTLSERSQATRTGSEASAHLPQGQMGHAEASLPYAAKGQSTPANRAGPGLPDAATERSAGQTPGADKASNCVPDASPRKLPGHARRGLAASRIANAERNASLFDSIKLPGDDRSIGDITWRELQSLAQTHAETYRLLTLINSHCVPADPSAKVRDVLKEDTLRQFVDIARLANVH
jgi:hypothetical protein